MLTDAIRDGINLPWKIACMLDNIRCKVQNFDVFECKWISSEMNREAHITCKSGKDTITEDLHVLEVSIGNPYYVLLLD